MYELSILIPTITSRKHKLDKLLDCLKPQLTSQVDLVINEDNGYYSIGEKRNQCLQAARGSYCMFVDDDDLLSDNAVALILQALESQPDAVGFKLKNYLNGEYLSYSVLSSTEARLDPNATPIVYGLPFEANKLWHLCPIRSEIAKSEKFPHINACEDSGWMKKILPKIKSEVFIDEFIYNYYFIEHTKRNETTNSTFLKRILKEKGIIDSEENICMVNMLDNGNIQAWTTVQGAIDRWLK